MRKKTRVVKLGSLLIGGGHPVVVQSMTSTDTRDIAATVAQIHQLEKAGCELVRVAVVDQEAALAIAEIKKRIHIPLVADIHFDYRLALQSIAGGCDGLRINPGNIGARYKVQEVVKACQIGAYRYGSGLTQVHWTGYSPAIRGVNARSLWRAPCHMSIS